jgi:pimeloyl-ACP methyl ester carboxylesterase/predicted glycosyltransferase
MQPLQPDRSAAITRDGVRVAYDVYGEQHSATILLLATWAIADARHWKFQVPVLARRYRVITIDGRGNGRSSQPVTPAAYAGAEYLADALAVLDATGTGQAVVAGLSAGGPRVLSLAAAHPDRVLGAVLIGGEVPSLAGGPEPGLASFTEDPGPGVSDWDLYNQHVWQRDYDRFLEFFWAAVFTEPHSTKAIEDGTEWAHRTTPEALAASVLAPPLIATAGELRAAAGAIRCPMLLIHGTGDAVIPVSRSADLAGLCSADLLLIGGGGHCPQLRDPIAVNRALLEFTDRVIPAGQRAPRRRTWTRARHRPRQVLYLSSPIGLGHARRDLAIAAELRKLHGDLRIDWLAQDPVTHALAASGEHVHPASAYLASESAHVESEAGEHDLHAFEAIRRMDEIGVANFSVLQDVVESGDYDLVAADEAWDLDHFWHENPELKRAAYAWMTDFVGWLPTAAGGEREAAVTADYNAEMISQLARFRRVRDRSIFIGDPDDIVPGTFGPGLPSIREWTEQNYDFAGYVTGFDPAMAPRRPAGEPPLVVVTAGGSGVGAGLLRKAAAAFPAARRLVPGLEMLVVAGPRADLSDLSGLPACDGLEIRGYVPDLHFLLATADLAITSGGLTTTMELAAARRPFLYFPLANHFEQQQHVRYRLERYRAGRPMDYASTTPAQLAAVIAEEISRPADCRPVSTGGAARAAALIADLL